MVWLMENQLGWLHNVCVPVTSLCKLVQEGVYLIYAIEWGNVFGSKCYQEQDKSFGLGDQTER
jgi:hypothetical protein